MRPKPALLRVATIALSFTALLQADQTISGNLSVTGNTDIDGSNLTFGTQSSTYGAGLLYNNADTDTLTYQLTRSTASWLWAHNSSTSAMRLNGSHELTLYKSDGSTAGVTITPASSTLSLGGSTLYRDGSGVLTTNSGLSVGGAFSATTFAASSGTLTGGSSGLTINAGGSGQNVTLSPSGSGYTLLNGNVGIGTSSPAYKVDILGSQNTLPMLNITNNGSSGYVPTLQTLAPNITAGQSTYIGFGKAESTYNMASLNFGYVGNSNAGNRVDLAFWGGGPVLTATAGGKVGIGNSTPYYKFDIGGTENTQPLLNINNQGTSAFVPLAQGLAPNLTAGQATYLAFGQSMASNNQASLGFHYAGNGSSSNRMDMAFWGPRR